MPVHLKKSKSRASDYDDLIYRMEGFDDCIVCVARQHGRPPFIVYNSPKVIAKLTAMFEADGSEQPAPDALEWFSYNMSSAWVGEGTPAFTEDRRMHGI